MKYLMSIAATLLWAGGAAAAQSIDARLQYLSDRLAIEDLMVGYATAHNVTEPELYRKLFTADAEIVNANGQVIMKGLDTILASVVKDRKRFNAGAKDGVRTYGNMRHVITNMEVNITGDTATGSCYLLNTAFNPKQQKPEILAMGRYEDEYVRQRGEWRIARRKIVFEWLGNDELARIIGVGPHTPPEYR